MRSQGFTLMELLIVMFVIAALIAALVPMGVHAIKEARMTTIALNLSELSRAAMQEFYFSGKNDITLGSLKGYFNSGNGTLADYAVKTSDEGTYVEVFIWYTGSDMTATGIRRILPSVVATSNGAPMVETKLSKTGNEKGP